MQEISTEQAASEAEDANFYKQRRKNPNTKTKKT
jgi:hypothetical protein